MAVGEITAILDTKTERVHKVCDNKREQDSKYFVSTKWVIDVDIKAFFSQISYQWILNNFPMVQKGYLKNGLRVQLNIKGNLKFLLWGSLNVVS
jgi:retron-type reverse transcriptase